MSSIGLAQAMAVALGSAIGALLRWGCGLALNALWAGFPLGTLVVNSLGGFAIGVAMVVFQRSPDALMRLFLVTGLLGGFTTFSAFSAESLGLLQRGDWGLAVTHTLAHVLGALGCAALGFMLAGRLLHVA
ncbi:MAG: fluoride efflux transporter CrcB [Burkholderiales bacterium]|nr:fluoride efflux transporter CrcB [Burkholderiales bacterium]